MEFVQRALALGGAAAHRGLVHDVVVVQRREVNHLDDGRRLMTSCESGRGPNCEARMANIGRNRLPPALARWVAASVMTSSPGRELAQQQVLDLLQRGAHRFGELIRYQVQPGECGLHS